MEELINPSKFSQILSVKKEKDGSYRLDRCFPSNTSEDMLQPINRLKETQNKKSGLHLLHFQFYAVTNMAKKRVFTCCIFTNDNC